MSVRIRLSRIGKKKAPFFRVVAIDQRNKRDGEYLENLGTYNPLTGEFVQFHVDRIQAWLDRGAIPSETVVKLQKRFAEAQKAAAAAPAKQDAKPKKANKKTAVSAQASTEVLTKKNEQAVAQAPEIQE